MARGRVTKFTGRNTYKNIVQTEGALADNATSTTVIAVADQIESVSQKLNEVPVGGTISAVFYSIYIYSNGIEADIPIINMYFWKNVSGQLTAPTLNNEGSSDAKSWIIHQEKGMAGNRLTGNPMIIKGVFRLPSKMKRFTLGDQIELKLKVNGATGKFCALFIYKVIY